MNKYACYEESVQSPQMQVDLYDRWFQEVHGQKAHHLREDFCGTFAVSCAWVKANKGHTAVGLDIEWEPLEYGQRNHLSLLTPDEQERVWIQQQDVLHPPAIKRDIIVAGNFSFNVFKKRSVLVEYFRACLKSLNRSGSFVLECAGGPGMIAKLKERRRVTIPTSATVKRQKQESVKSRSFTYIWEQRHFDPITHDAEYAIHFKFSDGTIMENAFSYDWRLWSLPELRDCLLEAGFNSTTVFWETSHKGEGTGEYVATANGDNAYSWIAYLFANKISQHSDT